jgi:hypothetical protein
MHGSVIGVTWEWDWNGNGIGMGMGLEWEWDWNGNGIGMGMGLGWDWDFDRQQSIPIPIRNSPGSLGLIPIPSDDYILITRAFQGSFRHALP